MIKGTKTPDDIILPDIPDPLVGLPEVYRKKIIQILEGDFNEYFKLVDFTGDEVIGGRHGTKPLEGKRKYALQWLTLYRSQKANGGSAEYHKKIKSREAELAQIDAEIMAICKPYIDADKEK